MMPSWKGGRYARMVKKVIGARVAKEFGDEKMFYARSIDKFNKRSQPFHITYDDGDGEDFDAEEVSNHLDMYTTIHYCMHWRLEKTRMLSIRLRKGGR